MSHSGRRTGRHGVVGSDFSRQRREGHACHRSLSSRTGFTAAQRSHAFSWRRWLPAGFVVIAPNHKDATCGSDGASWSGKPELPFRQSTQWNETTFQDRADDIRRLIDAPEGRRSFSAHAWTGRGSALPDIHSVGYTVLGLGGAWQSWKLENVQRHPGALSSTRRMSITRTCAISAPVMYQGGTRDLGVTPHSTADRWAPTIRRPLRSITSSSTRQVILRGPIL